MVIVPAHDEAGGIAATVESLTGQHYPAALIEINAVAALKK